MMMDVWAAHLLGNLLLLFVFGVGTIACFAAAIRMLIHPGEQNRDHPKYSILKNDR